MAHDDDAAAIYGALGASFLESALEEFLAVRDDERAATAKQVVDMVRGRMVINFWTKPNEQNALATELDDYFYDFGERHGVPMRQSLVDGLRRRARWILAQQASFADFRPHTPPRIYVPGETHLYLGRQYRIRVVPTETGEGASKASGTPGVKMVRGFLEVRCVDFHDTAAIEKLVKEWYRRRAQVQLPSRLELNRQRFPDPHAVQPTSLRLQRMPTRWGSASQAGSLVLNPDLIRAPMDCVDYVVTHELCHLLVPNHGRQFFELQRQVMPDWEQRKQRLERIMA